MISVNIGNEKVNFPDKIPLDKLKLISKYDLSDPDNYHRILNLLLEVEDMGRADMETIELLMGFLIVNLNNRVETSIINLEKLTFGQFIDLEVYLSNDKIKYIEEILNILSPAAKSHDEALWVIEKWLQWREVVFRQYKGLFGIEEEGDDDTPSAPQKPNHTAKIWFKTLIDLANDDILKIKQIEALPFRLCFNFMANRKEERKIKEMEILKNKRANELHRRS